MPRGARALTVRLMSLDRFPVRSTPYRRRLDASSLSPAERLERLSWAESHRGRRVAPPARSAGEACAKVVRPLAKRFGPGVSELDVHWREIVGEPLADWSKPERYQGGSSGSTLVVRARGPAAALVEAQSARILERVAAYSGRPVKRLKIVQGPIEPAGAPVRRKPPQRIVKATGPAPETVETDPHARLQTILNRWRAAYDTRGGD